MFQLKVLSGKKAGTVWVARRFPVRIGRAAAADLQLEESGVWDQHLKLDLSPEEGIVLSAQPNALATVNGQPAHRIVLRNGDAIDVGSLRMQFWLSEARQAGLSFREGLTWAGIAVVSLGQVGLIYWLLH
ncbi:MAG: FHA domain-containing protein [Verrucomicrobiota bacterium]